MQLILGGVGLFVFSLLLLFFIGPNTDEMATEHKTPKVQTNVSNPELKIDKNAYGVYTQTGYPKLYNAVGQAGLQDIAKHDVTASLVVAKRSDCDKVVYVGYSENKMNYPSKLASFVDCANGKRFYVINGVIE